MRNKKIFGIILVIIIILVLVSVLTNKPIETGTFSNDFVNENIVNSSSDVLPDNIKERFEDNLAKHIESQNTEENPYSSYLGEALNIMQLGDYKLSLEKLETLEENYPNDYLASMTKGNLLVKMNQYLSAANAYLDAINKKPVEALTHIKLIELYKKYSFNKQGAETIVLRALVDTNNHKEIQRHYAVFLEDREDYASSIEYWNEVLKKTDNLESRNAVNKKIRDLLERITVVQ